MVKNNINFSEIEDKWKNFWEKEKIYKAKNLSDKDIFAIDTPPPYISGKMHLGHAFSYSQQDFIARFMRMFKGNIFYPFGTDDNGLPTEKFVEKKHKIKSTDMSRKDFIDLCLKYLKKITPECVQDWKDLGLSADFDVSYSTIDFQAQKVSQRSFIELFKKNEIYKKDFPTLWCPECKTSIAQAELEDKETKTLFSTLKFSCGGKDLLIATTRPEMLGACVAVFVNPKDKRYKSLVGKVAKVPLFDFEVPILADDSADPEKGTGVLMICSYGDKFDVESINHHKLDSRVIINEDGTLNIGKYKGLRIKEARKKILEDLEKNKLITENKKISHVVNVHDRCGTEIEFIQTKQWFTRIVDKKKIWIEQGRKIKWYPEFMRKRYENWVNGLDWDWSISRNRHFGVPIPVWECEKCGKTILPERKELPVDPLQISKKCSCGGKGIPEKMVLDTWATSSLSPQIASDLVDNKVEIPFSLRPNAHDIIRTWAFYTIVKAYLHKEKLPWKDIVISGVVSLGGEKMSKSKGNVIEPREILEKFGADALRFWAAGSKLGNDLDYQEKDLIAGKKFVNKLMNASKFVFMNLENWDGKKPAKIEKLDELFLEELNKVISSCTENFSNYEYSKAKQDIEQFFWKDFADMYLEIIKKRVYQGKGNSKKSAQYTLYTSLLAILKMVAPIMPFVTEEIYQTYFKKYEKDLQRKSLQEAKSIHLSSWPKAGKIENKESLVDIYEIVSKVRSEKTKEKKSMNSEIILNLDEKVFKKLEGMVEDLKNVTNAREIKVGKFEVEFVNPPIL